MKMLVNGTWIGDGDLPVRNPYTGAVIGAVPSATPELVDQCVRTAACFRSKLTAWERFEILNQAAQEVFSRKDEMSRLISQEAGIALCSTRREVERAYHWLLRLKTAEPGSAL